MASPLRFRRSNERWNDERVRSRLYASLNAAIGATSSSPWFSAPPEYEARRFDMENGDTALFAWRPDDAEAYWIGNTETPKSLWRTEKFTFEEVPYPIARWAQREWLAELERDEPWLADFPYLSWFFLPVFCSKDGRESSRTFFRDHAAGFPDASREEGASFYEDLLRTGVFDDERYVMASKLGTSQRVNLGRMSATMSEFTVARILLEAGYEVTPEIEVGTGHSLDFRADDEEGGVLVEVTRPLPLSRRSASSPVRALRETTKTKADGQLAAHGGGAVLFVDLTSFTEDQWRTVQEHRPEVHHRPAVVFRARPDGRYEAYTKGSVPLSLPMAAATPS